MSTIFISHSTQDKAIALQVLERLREQGYEALFLDSDPEAGIKAGRDWERDLYRNLRLAAAVVILCSPDSMASRWCFAEITQAKALGKALFPVMIRPCEVVGSLTDRQVVDFTAQGADEGFRRLFDGLRVAGLDPGDSFDWDTTRPPFPGLNSFESADAGIYFGREAEIRLVIETLTRMQRQGEPRLLVVVGSSGSGKSSLVRAGVLPRLRKERSRWVVIEPFRPGTEPVSELARSLSLAFPEGSDRPGWKVVRDRIGDEARGANPGGPGDEKTVSSVLGEYGDDLTMALGRRDASMLVVVDQAEELLQGLAPEESATFFTVLRHATSRPAGRVFGLLTLRSDFLGSFQNHPALRGVVFADIPLGPMPLDRFPELIEGPAARAEIALEPGLVPTLIAEARTEDALPLLAFTLRELYERCRERARFTLRVYRDDLGGILGAVARAVERIKPEGEWTGEVGLALRRSFLKLARVNDEGRFTRQRARWVDLPDNAAPALEKFVRARLLTSDGDTVEVTHESLFRVWPDLAGWLDESREFLLWSRRLQGDVAHWERAGRPPALLLSEGRLGEARKWLAERPDDLGPVETEFINLSAAERRREAEAEALRQRRELETQKRLTEEAEARAREQADAARRQHAQARRIAIALGVAVLFFIAASASSFYAFRQHSLALDQASRAELQARVADARRLVAEALPLLKSHPQRALLLAIEATRATRLGDPYDPAPEQALRDLLSQTGGSVIGSYGERVVVTRFDGDSRLVVTAAKSGEVRIRSGDRPGAASVVLKGHGDLVFTASFSPDGKLLATLSSDDTVRVWTLDRPDHSVVLGIKGQSVSAAVFSPDGKLLATGWGDGTVRIWRIDRLDDPPSSFRAHQFSIETIAFSPDGKLLATGGLGKGVRISRVDRPDDAPVHLPVEQAVYTVGFSPDGKLLATGDYLWRVDRPGDTPVRLPGHEDIVSEAVFSPDGKLLATGSYDRTVRLWQVDTPGVPPEVYRGHEGMIETLCFGSHGKQMITGDQDGEVRYWRLDRPVADPIVLHERGEVHTFAVFSPDGKLLATTSSNGTNRLRRLDRLDDEPVPLRGQTGWVLASTFSPDGKFLTTAAHDDTVRQWKVDSPSALPVVLHQGPGLISSAAFRRDGLLLATGGNDGMVRLWRVGQPGDSPTIFRGHKGPVRSAAFSPDGKLLATVGAESPVQLCRLDQPDAPPVVLREMILTVGFSPDGKLLATEREGGALCLTRLDRPGAPPVSLTLDEANSVVGVTFSRDSSFLAASSAGATLLYRLSEPDSVPVVLRSDVRRVYSAFSPDGKLLATSGEKGSTRLWLVDLKDLIRLARETAGRDLTSSERQKFHIPLESPER